MRYFMYSPIDMSETEAFNLAYPYLSERHIIRVVYDCEWGSEIQPIPILPGLIPRAAPETHLIKVELDGSTRLVHDGFISK